MTAFLPMLRAVIFLVVLLAGASPGSLLAAGTIAGSVKDKANGKFLAGATIRIEGSRLGAVSGRGGTFSVSQVPAGEHTVVITYLGYEKYTQTVRVNDEAVALVDAELSSTILQKEGVVVTGMLQGQARALNQQKTAANIKNVAASDDIGRFPDLNTAEALQRMPALSIQRDQGEGRYVLIRGTEARLNSVMINGERIPSPEGDIRSVALDVIPSDVLASIEVNKALTPDMDGDAIGGSINLVTKSAFDSDRPMRQFTVAGGYNDIVSDGAYQLAALYGNRFGKDKELGLLVGGSYFKTNRGSDNNEMEWLTPDDVTELQGDLGLSEDPSVKVVETVDLRDYEVSRERLGINAAVDYQLGTNSSVYLRGLYNRFGDQEYRRRLIAGIGANDYTSVGAGGGSTEGAEFERELKNRFEEQIIYSISAGGSHDLNGMLLDYNLAYSYAEEDEPDARYINFKLEDVNLNYDVSDSDTPKYSATNGVDIFNSENYEFDELSIESNRTTDQEVSAGLNLSLPYTLGEGVGTVKVGVKYRAKNKDRINDIRIFDGYDGEGDLTLDQVDGNEEPEKVQEGYRMGFSPDPDLVDALIDNRLDEFELDSDATREDSDSENYEATENVLAAYAMTTVQYGKLMILPGLRFEMTDLSYEGNQVILDEDGNYESTTPVSQDDDYANILPMIHFRYNVQENTVLRLAWTNSLARPNYFDLVPYSIVNREDEEIAFGNPELEPTESMNLDFSAEHYLPSLGLVSAGVFYKQLNEYIYYNQVEIEQGEFAGFEGTTPRNGESATLFGFELAWQQQLGFLPGFLNGFGMYANYTYTDSEAEFPGREGTSTLPGQATHVANIALSYEKHGFSGRVSLNYHGKYVDEVGESAAEDVYYDNHVQVDVSLSQQLMPGLRVFAEFLNLGDAPLRYYIGEEDRPIQREFYSWWGQFGVKYQF